MAVVSGIPITPEQFEELSMYQGEGSGREYRFSIWPDNTITVDDGAHVIIEFVLEELADDMFECEVCHRTFDIEDSMRFAGILLCPTCAKNEGIV